MLASQRAPFKAVSPKTISDNRLGGEMKKAVHWIASSAAAGLIFFLLEKLLPADITRGWLIAIGGLAGILWSNLIDWPLKTWSQDR